MSSFPSPLGTGRIRPASEIFLNAPRINEQNQEQDALDKVAQKWLADLDTYENTLQEMAAAALDQDFKDELTAIEEWFRVLSEAERTAALYALLQQTTQVQIRFFITVLQQMAKEHPVSAMLSPANFEKDAMSNRMSEAMANLNVSDNRNSFGSRPPPSPTVATNRNSTPSGLDSSAVHAMFPDAAAAIENQRQKFSQQTGTRSNRASALFEARTGGLGTPTITTTNSSGNGNATKDNSGLPPPPGSPWRQSQNDNSQDGPRKSESQTVGAMGQWQAPPPSAGLRSSRPQLSGGNGNLQTTTINVPTNNGLEGLPPLSPYDGAGGNWASMVNTPVVPMFGNQASPNVDMVANATAMKLAALSTVNNRIILDSDMPKYKRKNRLDGQALPSPRNMQQQTMSPTNIVMYNEHGQPIPMAAAAAVAAAQAAQNNLQRRSRPNSPGLQGFQSPGPFQLPFSPQNNGFLAAYDTSSPLLNGGAFNLGALGAFGTGSEGYLSDGNVRGRSPRGRRGSSKPPEDPTDINLLNDIPHWLRSLRLHKYTDNLKDLKWTELIELNDEDLEKRGVNALGARRKMLKVFEQVKEAKQDGKIKAWRVNTPRVNTPRIQTWSAPRSWSSMA